MHNHRLQKLDQNGNFLGWIGKDDQGGTGWHGPGSGRVGVSGSGDGEFHYVGGGAVDSSGNLYIADHYGNRVQKFTPVVEVIEVAIDIKPDTLNLKSKGKWITCYIELPEGHNVDDIDISTILLNDQVPAESHPTGIGDNDNDGVPDLMVKFDRSAVQQILQASDDVEIVVTGELNDGTPFEGSDMIRVIDKGKKK